MNNKVLMFLLLIFSLLSFAQTANAQFTGQLSTAENMRKGRMMYGGFLGIYDDISPAVFGQVRRGFGLDIDAGARFGFISIDAGRDDDETGVLVGGDAKFRILDNQTGDAFDLSAGPALEAAITSDFSIFTVGGNLIGSMKFISQSGLIITPYGRFSLRFQNVSWDNDKFDRGLDDNSDSSLEFSVSLGSAFTVSDEVHLLGEVQLADDFLGFIAGINYGG
ncbi:MAG: hypothetical protein GF307_14715 [candidate division Zixibacteria bacterium]|nr:hypothetical protein [candidate division Zixibacteria bacterium]